MKDRISDFFATLWPLLMLLTLHLFIAANFEPFINVYLLFSLILLTNLTAFYLYRSYQGVRGNHSIMVFRLLIFYLVFLWLLYKLLSGEFFQGNFNPVTLGGIYTVILGLISWSLTIFFAQTLVYRENFMAIFEGLPTEELASKSRQYSYELQEVQEKTKKIRLLVLVFTVVSLFLLLGIFFILKSLYTFQVIVYLVLLVFCLAFIFFTRGLDEESLLISEGIRLNPQWTALKERRFFLILLFLAIPSFLISRCDFSLPYSLIGDFFEWLDGLFQVEQKESIQRVLELPNVQRGQQGMGSPLSMLGEMEERQALFTDEVKRMLKLFLIGCGAAGFLFFLVAPLLRKSSRRENKGILKRSLKDMGRYFINFFLLLKPHKKGKNSRASGKLKLKRRSQIRSMGRSNIKDREVQTLPSAGKILRAFNRLVRWGNKRGYPYQVGLSPSDYLISLIKLVPHRKKDIHQLAHFLDRYFYSAQVIDSHDIDNFIIEITTLIKEERRK